MYICNIPETVGPIMTAKACNDIVTTIELASLSTPKMSITTTEFLKDKTEERTK